MPWFAGGTGRNPDTDPVAVDVNSLVWNRYDDGNGTARRAFGVPCKLPGLQFVDLLTYLLRVTPGIYQKPGNPSASNPSCKLQEVSSINADPSCSSHQYPFSCYAQELKLLSCDLVGTERRAVIPF